MKKLKGFTLIEMLVVIAIIAVVLALALPNYLGVRERARDAKRKVEMRELKSALRLYYNDFNTYPANFFGGVGKINYIRGCGTNGSGQCPCSTTLDFASGGSCETVYMKKFPSDLGTSMYYYLATGGDDFCLKVPLENKSDSDIAASQARCNTACGANCAGVTDYCTCAD